MTVYACEDAACRCVAHINWTTHVPIGRCCSLPLVDDFGDPLTEDATRGNCTRCPRSWQEPDPQLLSRGEDNGIGWDWGWRDDYDWRDLQPVAAERDVERATRVGVWFDEMEERDRPSGNFARRLVSLVGVRSD